MTDHPLRQLDEMLEESMTKLFLQPKPIGLIRYWVPDGQGGGEVEFVTREESDRRDAWSYLTDTEYTDDTSCHYDEWIKT